MLTWRSVSLLFESSELGCFLKDLSETLYTPSLSDFCKRAVVRDLFMQLKTGEPSDGDIDLRFTHELSVVDNPMEDPPRASAEVQPHALRVMPGRPLSRQ